MWLSLALRLSHCRQKQSHKIYKGGLCAQLAADFHSPVCTAVNENSCLSHKLSALYVLSVTVSWIFCASVSHPVALNVGQTESGSYIYHLYTGLSLFLCLADRYVQMQTHVKATAMSYKARALFYFYQTSDWLIQLLKYMSVVQQHEAKVCFWPFKKPYWNFLGFFCFFFFFFALIWWCTVNTLN